MSLANAQKPKQQHQIRSFSADPQASCFLVVIQNDTDYGNCSSSHQKTPSYLREVLPADTWRELSLLNLFAATHWSSVVLQK
mmetsp:Transcript_7361/g.17442  ORF Transcript_7361/g.17442 Transcript_7361/m.17442 type:complete len:82 (-) Transcript_7361:809-1054(-)